MLSVVIPSLNAERRLPRTLAALVPGAVAGLVKEVIVADGGSSDATCAIADAAGATVIAAPRGRGSQLAAGAAAARGEWLMFLHADTVPEEGWIEAVEDFIRAAGEHGERASAACFRFALDDPRTRARVLEAVVAARCALFALPYGDQGLIMSRAHYRRLGGFGDMALMEDVDMVRRIGRSGFTVLRHRAVTSAERYRRQGFAVRGARNLACLALYFLRVPPTVIRRLYG